MNCCYMAVVSCLFQHELDVEVELKIVGCYFGRRFYGITEKKGKIVEFYGIYIFYICLDCCSFGVGVYIISTVC